ncbi:hypothetical protein CPT_Magnus_167 [Klebsiella phage Magnus]|uniref:Uncharacterized protein n=2 Tax=Taipeivirus TaxID=2731621 RepID=A0A2H5BNF6_9CAUD|nr:hypothetical protein HOS54_gp081 [Klebsiella phage Menlow]YP_009883578.1 hypothetical protein HYP92_gp074 [Klebsiella phage Magnus]AUG87868.1 hypothetical protein CPT_Menlow_167 [Klebsiella phage Menlow]QEG08046.1 hypothetical protein CPT_Magnus_167 [Klebsiella phage Magnus]
MSYILHIESGLKFDIEGKTASDVQSEIKDAGLLIGNVTIRRMLDGVLQSANGFELIDSLSQEEQEETLEALDRAKAEEVQPTDVAGVKEGAGAATPVIDAKETVDQPEAEQTANSEESTETAEQADPQEVEAVANADEVRRRILGTNVAEALAEGGNAAEDASLAAKSKLTNLTPAVAPEDRKRRHNKREEMVEAARSSNFGAILAAVEAGVIPGVYLSYVNPDMRWFQFPVTDLADKENPHARTNTYVDLAPITSGGWGFSLYVKGKSFTKRQKIKETDAESLVKAINEWLPGALEEAKNAG